MQSKRKLTILAAVLVCLLFLPVLASADYIVAGDNVKFTRAIANTWNGPFIAHEQNAPTTQDFLTFCVQSTETFNLDTYYKVKSVSTNVIVAAPAPSSAVLTSNTAYLYSQFRQGAITLDDKEEANGMQAAIYFYQGLGEMYQPTSTTYKIKYLTADNTYTEFASTETAWNQYKEAKDLVNDDEVTRSGFYGVRVINLGIDGKNQDMLTTVPLPGAVLLLGAGMARLVAYARRRQED